MVLTTTLTTTIVGNTEAAGGRIVPTFTRHNHHRHRRPETLMKRDTTKLPSLPTMTQAMAHTSSSASISIGIPAGDVATNNYVKNPYISVPDLPSGLVFIITGSIIGCILMGSILYRMITYFIHNIKAKQEKEVYYHNFNNHLLWSDSSTVDFTSTSSINLEKTHSSNSSLFKLSNNFYDVSTLIDTTPGRSYRDTVVGKGESKSNRGSMFISPVLDVMAMKNTSELTLPLYHKPMLTSSSCSLLTLQNDLQTEEYDTHKDNPCENSSGDIKKSPQLNNLSDMKNSSISRPPSQYLEDLLNDE
jgi:hypothetical protein